jgi:hypothetical protein
MAVYIQTGHIVWVNGSYPGCEWADLRIFRQALKFKLRNGETVEVDAGYADGGQYCLVPNGISSAMRAQARERHETVTDA